MFLSPKILWLLLVLIPLALIIVYTAKRKQLVLKKFMAERHWPQLVKGLSTTRFWVKSTLFVTACFFLILALARPTWGEREQVYIDRGLDILVAFDVSTSMLAEDVQPNRLEHAKSRIRELISQIPGHRIGLMPFSGDAFIISPMTSDYNFMRERLDVISTKSIRTPGTNFANALDVARFAFQQGSVGKKVLILITDGEDHSQEFLDSLEKAKEEGIIIYALGIGSTEGAELPFQSLNSAGGNREREQVISKLNPESLRKLAQDTGGSAYISTIGTTLNINPLAAQLNSLATNSKQQNETKLLIREDRFQFPLIIAFLVLILEMLLSNSPKTIPALLSRRAS